MSEEKKTKAAKKNVAAKPEGTPKTTVPVEGVAEAKPAKKRTVVAKTKPKKRISKRFTELKTQIEKGKTYPIEEAITLAKKTGNTKFDGSVEVHLRLGIDVKKSDQLIRGAVTLPHGTGKNIKVAAIVSEAKEKEAKEAGADIVGGQEFIDKIKQTGKIDFDVAVASPDMMPKLAVVAKVLGPKGLMPSPKNETITTNLAKTISELKKGKVNFKNDDTANVHNVIGKTSFDAAKLVENFNTYLNAIKRSKPASSKGVFIRNASINATMGPGIKIQVS